MDNCSCNRKNICIPKGVNPIKRGPQGLRGPTGPRGPRGQEGPTGTLVLSNYLTSRVEASQTLAKDQYIEFGSTLTFNGGNITHTTNTDTFTLAGGQTYMIEYAINGTLTDGGNYSGMFFSLVVGPLVSNTRVVSQNTQGDSPYNAGWTSAFVSIPSGSSVDIKIMNLGPDTVSIVNGNISILQITNN